MREFTKLELNVGIAKAKKLCEAYPGQSFFEVRIPTKPLVLDPKVNGMDATQLIVPSKDGDGGVVRINRSLVRAFGEAVEGNSFRQYQAVRGCHAQ